MKREPNFDNILKIFRREAPDRPTLFEFFLNTPLYEKLAGEPTPVEKHSLDHHNFLIKAFAKAGYDYATTHASAFRFPVEDKHIKHTASLNDGITINDRDSFGKLKWLEPEDFDDRALRDVTLPGNMKLMVAGPGGVLENVIALVGYDNLCIMIYEDPQLVHDIFEEVGTRLVKYYESFINYDTVGILMSNDDWGFKTQTMLSPEHMREYVFPWHKQIVKVAHKAGKPAVLHSCGYFEEIIDDVINDLKYDGKHSFEDTILPVENAYKKWGDKIAIMGGIDLHFVVTSTPDEIKKRCKSMLNLAGKGFALGTGNSVPEYVPDENYFAMTSVALA